jgi:hypothetical protein
MRFPMNQYPAVNPYAPPQTPLAGPAYAQAPYGVTPSSARVEGKLLVAENGSALPAMCMKCGGAPTHWRAQRYQYTPPMAVFFLGWLGILIFNKKSNFQVPLCEAHRADWKKWNLLAGVSWIPGVLLWIIGAALGGSAGGVMAVLGTAVFFVGLIGALILRSRKIVMPTKIDKTHSWLRGVAPVVLQTVASPQQHAPQAYAQPSHAGYPS